MSGIVEPIAIVGMACRFPNGLDSISELWNTLKNRISAIGPVPEDRWTANRYYSSNPIAKGKSYIRRGGFLKQNVRTFDASFFGISPRDAENMDPQQRILLEVVWEAFENSGLKLPEYAKKQVGVYVGGFMLDHMISQMGAANRSAINQNTAAGMMMTMLSNRISHTFDFRGPSFSVDTACSSSLVAFHYACQDIWNGNTEMAVVGGSNVMLRPEYPMGMCKGHFLSQDGECKSFDIRGDGYGRGEGAGIVLLQPLSKAMELGSPVLGLVVATGSNQDGHTPGISMPSGEAQQALIEQVCRRFSIDPASIDYVECHGTGTAIGDPTESGAIGRTYGKARRESGKSPVIVGSVKSNIGHLEAAAGVAGVIKATLTLLHRETSPLGNLKEVNPAIEFEQLHVQLSDRAIALGTSKDEPIRVAVNSFGYGGSNAHVILQSSEEELYKPRLTSNKTTSSPRRDNLPFVLPLTARSDKALRKLCTKYTELLGSGVAVEDVIHSTVHQRALLSDRAVVMGGTAGELIEALTNVAAGTEDQRAVIGKEPFQGERLPVIVFTGMGPQWWAMGQELYSNEPVYRTAVEQADAVFQQISGFSVLAEMLKSEAESQIHITEYAQPANFLIQIGLYEVLKSYGVVPGAVVGHSVGELASAYYAGALTLKDAMTVCYHRSRLQAKCRGTGAMLAVGLGKDKMLPRLEAYEGKVSVAAANGPSNITIAGDSDAIADISEQLTTEGVFNKLLQVEVPYHSPMMDPILDELRDVLARIQPSLPSTPLYSTVTGELVDEILYGAEYWTQNVRQPVEFAAAITKLLEAGYTTFLEVGPHPVLATSIQDCIKLVGKDCRLAYTLRRNQPELINVQRSVLSLIAYGCNVDWNRLAPTGKSIDLPNYPWQREHYWVENDRAMQDRIAPITHPMLGLQEAPGAPMYRNDFDHEPMLYLRDHVVSGLPILPAAGYIESLLELAFLQNEGAKAVAIRDLEIMAPMVITAERGLDSVTAYDPKTQMATIRSLENGRLGAGQVHVTAKLNGLSKFKTNHLDLSRLMDHIPVEMELTKFYQGLAAIGLQYGPAFQTINKLYRTDDRSQILAEVAIKPEGSFNAELYCLHPTVLDACFQALMPMLTQDGMTFLPTGFSELCVYQPQLPTRVWCHATATSQTAREIFCDLTLADETGAVVASLRGMRLSAASRRERVDQFGDKVKRQILNYTWNYGESLTEPKRLGHWLVVGDENELAQRVMDRLEQYGATISGMVTVGEQFNVDGKRFTVKRNEAADLQNMLEQVGELDGLVFFSGLTANEKSDDPTAESALKMLVQLTQGLLKSTNSRLPRVYVVTQNAHITSEQDTAVSPAQTALNGFVRVAYNELDGMRFSSIDIPQRIDERLVDNLTLELVCDSDHDEVALRGALRLTSELLDSNVLTDDSIARQALDDQHPVAVRALRPDCESVGTARIVAMSYNGKLPSDSIRIRIEATLVPTDLLLNPDSDMISQPLIEVIGEVIEVGESVIDLNIGDRVAGFAPSDIASHFVGPRSAFYLAPMPAADSTDVIFTRLADVTRAHYIVQSLDMESIKTAAVVDTFLGRMVAQLLSNSNVEVALLRENFDIDSTYDFETTAAFTYCPEGMAQAVKSVTNGRGFDLLVVSAGNHQSEYGFDLLSHGGTVVDLDQAARPIQLQSKIASVIRSDFATMATRPVRFHQSLVKALDTITTCNVEAKPALQVTIADLAWQKLPLADASIDLILTFDCMGSDLPVVQSDELYFDHHATYLITGGFGGFGRKTAEWLIAHGAKHIVLTGRTGADTPDKKAFVESLEQLGVAVNAAACDTANYDDLAKLFDQIKREMPPLRGVFHSGAVILDQPVGEIDLKTFSSVIQSKAQGAWNLHLLTESMQLDHFVLYSSLANLVGNSRQTAYSAANGFLNGLAHMRTKRGLPGTSVNWGAIADVGVVANDEKLEQFLKYTGLRGIESSEGLELLRIGLKRRVAQFGVTVITTWRDWARFETRGSKSPRFATLIAADSTDKDDSTRAALLEELIKLQPSDQVELLGSLIVEIVAHVLKAAPEDISMDRAINQLGVDSLMATEIQSMLDSQLGLQVSILELIGDSTIRALASKTLKSLMETAA